MNEDFVPYELAVKLKEKGFECGHPLAMYNEKGVFHDLCTSAEYMISASGFECRCYYDYEDFDEHDCVAPTISQVLKWLRKEKIFVVIAVNPTLSTKDKIAYYYQVYPNSNGVTSDYYESEECYAQWEDCAIYSIKYVLDNLI